MESLLSYLPDLKDIGYLGYWLVFLFSLGESVVITGWFVPGTLFLIVMGGLSARGYYDPVDMATFAIAGAIIGDAISYEVGRKSIFHVERISWLKSSMVKGKDFFHRHKEKSVFLGRFVGPIRPVIPFVAGVLGMQRTHFYMANILSAFGWCIAYLAIGYLFGEAWDVIGHWSKNAAIALALMAAVIAAGLWVRSHMVKKP